MCYRRISFGGFWLCSAASGKDTIELFSSVCQKLAPPSACGQFFHSGHWVDHRAAESDRKILHSDVGFGCFPMHFSFSLFNNAVVVWKGINKQSERTHPRSLWYPCCSSDIHVTIRWCFAKYFHSCSTEQDPTETEETADFKVNIFKPLPCFRLPSICFQGNRRRSQNQ